METIDDLLNAVKQKHGIKSDYKLAAFTGKTQNTIANYRHGRSRPDDKTLSEFADLADIPKSQIELMAVRFQVERSANSATRELWAGIAKRLQIGFSSILFSCMVAIIAIAATALPVRASTVSVSAESVPTVYYVKLTKQARCLFSRYFVKIRKFVSDSCKLGKYSPV